ncbi:hypothetical protein KUCAC02_020508 [Chaenocephalus aceratus]|nr:hypothetical protein KUCAC02_020508 [Chaenocephalus aceratus]
MVQDQLAKRMSPTKRRAERPRNGGRAVIPTVDNRGLAVLQLNSRNRFQYSILGHISSPKNSDSGLLDAEALRFVASPCSGVHTRTSDLDPGLDSSASVHAVNGEPERVRGITGDYQSLSVGFSAPLWEMEGAEVNDGHYAGLGLLVQCLFTGWSSISPAPSLVALALMLADSDLLAPSARCSLAPVHSRVVSDPTWSCSAGLGLMMGD